MERHYLTIIKDVDRPVGTTEHFISAVVYCEQSSFERISSYYISCFRSKYNGLRPVYNLPMSV